MKKKHWIDHFARGLNVWTYLNNGDSNVYVMINKFSLSSGDSTRIKARNWIHNLFSLGFQNTEKLLCRVDDRVGLWTSPYIVCFDWAHPNKEKSLSSSVSVHCTYTSFYSFNWKYNDNPLFLLLSKLMMINLIEL